MDACARHAACPDYEHEHEHEIASRLTPVS